MVTKIGITGGAGFIGSNLASKISKQYEVLILDNFSTGRKDYLKDIKCHVRDVELSDASETIDSTKDLDVIFHLAASGNVVESINDPITNFNNNVLTTLNILVSTSEWDYVYFSSTGGALMGKAIPPVDEATQPAPISPYGASKLACESYIKVYAECYGLCYVIFRFGNVIGANSAHKKGVINTFYKQIKAGENIKVYGNVSRDFIDVDKLTDDGSIHPIRSCRE